MIDDVDFSEKDFSWAQDSEMVHSPRLAPGIEPGGGRVRKRKSVKAERGEAGTLKLKIDDVDFSEKDSPWAKESEMVHSPGLVPGIEPGQGGAALK